MRAPLLFLLALCVACGSADEEDTDEEDTPPVCDDHPLATQDCRDEGLMLADGTVTGVYCAAGGPNDGSWPEGCERLNVVSISTVTYCCPW